MKSRLRLWAFFPQRHSGYLGLNIKIAAMFIFLIIAIVLASSIKLYVEFSDLYRDRIVEDQKQVTLQNRSHLNNLINSIDQATMLLYADRTVMGILNRVPDDYEITNLKQQINEQLVKFIYIPLSNTLSNYEITFFANMDLPFSPYLTGSTLSLRGIYNTSGVTDAAWYMDTVKADGALHWFTDETDPNRMHVSRLIIYNPSTNDEKDGSENRMTLGVVVLNFDTAQIQQQIEASKLTAGTQMILLDRAGTILYSQNRDRADPMMAELNAQGIMSTGKPDLSGETSVGGRKHLYQIYSATNGWRLVVLLPYSDITKQLDVVLNIIVTTTVIALVLGIALAFYLSNRISRPIRRLAGTMGGILNPQNMQISLAPPTNDEVGVLYVSFNRLMKRMHELMDDVYQSGIKEKEAELKALQAQINPHFLYNTLDSVNWIALGIGADRIATIISSLANILRYSIKDPNEPVTAREEIDQVKDYINVQMLCYDHLFDVEFDIDPAIYGLTMPKLVLQPLVENAIQHGIERAQLDARLTVRGFVSADAAGNKTMVLSVDNTGDGLADAARINGYLQGRDLLTKPRGGYGIRNVNRRIQLVYGSAYGLHYDNNDVMGVTASITLPFSEQETCRPESAGSGSDEESTEGTRTIPG